MKVWLLPMALMLLGVLQTIYGVGKDALNNVSSVNTTSISIRTTDKFEDIEEFLSTVHEEDKALRWFIDELTDAFTGKWFRKALSTRCVWLAYDNEKAVGMAVLRVFNPWWDELANGDDRMELQSLLVSNTVRSRGVGRALYQVAENKAKAKGAQWLTLNAIAEAIPFYLKLGFEDAQKTRYGFFMKKSLSR